MEKHIRLELCVVLWDPHPATCERTASPGSRTSAGNSRSNAH